MMMKNYRKIFLTLLFVAVILLFISQSNVIDENDEENIPSVYFPLKNILSDEATLNVSKSRQIFLLETHMNEERIISNPRQACTVESAARTNPDMEIYFMLGTKTDHLNLKMNEIVEGLVSYPNIHIRYVNPKEFSKGTILENFFERDAMKNSSYPIEHMADVMRILTLNKYGGQYLDLDIISLVPIKVINRPNSACAENNNVIANGIMNLDNEEFGGKVISNKYLELINSTYSPYVWGGNGPVMFYKVVTTFCNGTKLSAKDGTQCGNFTVLPTSKCYPIFYNEWQKVYQDEHKEYVLKKLNDTGAHFLHVWNKMQDFGNKQFKLKFDSTSAYMELAKLHCPKVYESLVKYF